MYVIVCEKGVYGQPTKKNLENIDFVHHIPIVIHEVASTVGDGVGKFDVVGDSVDGKLSTASTKSLQYAKSSTAISAS